jgi:hypothetical protein
MLRICCVSTFRGRLPNGIARTLYCISLPWEDPAIQERVSNLGQALSLLLQSCRPVICSTGSQANSSHVERAIRKITGGLVYGCGSDWAAEPLTDKHSLVTRYTDSVVRVATAWNCLHHTQESHTVRVYSGTGKAVPLHAMKALWGRGGIAPTYSRPRH